MAKKQVETRKITEAEAENCASEPIHIIGGIQPHGFQLIADPDTLKIVQYSSNFIPLLNSHLADSTLDLNAPILATDMAHWGVFKNTEFKEALSDTKLTKLELDTSSLISPEQWECLAYTSNGWLSFEFLPISHESFSSNQMITQLNNLAELLRVANNQQTLFDVVTTQLQQYTQYDRVMMYRFLPDWSGEVVSECVSQRESIKYKGLRFPAEDIPKQAREMYTKNKVRVFADVNANSVQLIPNHCCPIDNQEFMGCSALY